MDSNRLKRVESLMLSELANIIQTETQDSKLKWITLTDIKVSADLSYAKVYIIARDETQIKDTIKALNQRAKYLRYQLALRMKDLRKIPELHFYYDHSIHYASRIEELLKGIEYQSDES